MKMSHVGTILIRYMRYIYSVRSGQIRNPSSARISMPGQVMRYNVTITECSGYHIGYRQGDKTNPDIRTEESQISEVTMTTASSLDSISEDENHVMPAPPQPSSSVNA